MKYIIYSLLLAPLAYLLWQANDARSWPEAQGVIVDSRVVSELRPGHSRRAATTNYDIDLSYTFSVEGTDYTGHRIAVIHRVYSSNAEAQWALKQYPVGKAVAVYYDPNDPRESVLDP